MSGALIGVVDQKIEKKEHESWNVNKIGGTPSWLKSTPVAPPACGLCGRPCALITQLYCPLGVSAYHRCVYVIACLSACSLKPQGWKVFRSLKLDETYAVPTSDSEALDDDWGNEAESWLDDQDDWGMDGADDWGTAEVPSSEKPEIPGQTCVVDEDSEESSSIDSRSTGELDADAFARLSISAQSSSSLATSALATPGPGADSSGAQGDIGELTEEPVMLVQDEHRMNAVAALLNTSLPQASEGTSSQQPGHISCLQPHFLYVIDEPAGQMEDGSDTSGHIADLIRNYEQAEGTTLDNIVASGAKRSGKGGKEGYEKAGSGKGGKEGYEKSELKHGDKIFHKFHKRLQRCPRQCVRYERGASPLLIRPLESSDQPAITPCPLCGGPRVFELQLLPPLIPSLRLIDGSLSPVEFGTVLVFTCEANCWSDDRNLVEEQLLLQADPDEHLYTRHS